VQQADRCHAHRSRDAADGANDFQGNKFKKANL